MIDYNMPKLQIGDLTVEKPIIQGGMGVGISLSGLASAVANEGGIGVISSVERQSLKTQWMNPEPSCRRTSDVSK